MIDEISGFHEPVIAYGQEAPSRISRASSWDSSTIRFSASIVSADAHHGKCANENFPKSKYGSPLKGCRR